MKRILLVSLLAVACAGPASKAPFAPQTAAASGGKDIPVFLKGGPSSRWHALGAVMVEVPKTPGLTEDEANKRLLQMLRRQAAAAQADAVVEAQIAEERVGTRRIPLGSMVEYKPREAWVARGTLVQYDR